MDVEVAIEVVVFVDDVALLVAAGRQAQAVGLRLEDDAVRARCGVGSGDGVAQRAVGIADAVIAVFGLVDDEVGGVGDLAAQYQGDEGGGGEGEMSGLCMSCPACRGQGVHGTHGGPALSIP